MDPLRIFDENLQEARGLLTFYDTFLTTSQRDIRQAFRWQANRMLRQASGLKTFRNRSNSKGAFVFFTDSCPMGWKHLRHASLRPFLRMALVQAVSAMDCYFHDQIEWHYGRILSTATKRANSRFLSFPIPTGAVKNAIDSYTRTTVGLRIAFQKELRRVSIQGPGAIEDTLRIIGVRKFWTKVSRTVGVDTETLLLWLNQIATRRNQIVHEGDRIPLQNGRLSKPRDIRRNDVEDDIHVLDCFVYAIHDVIEAEATA